VVAGVALAALVVVKLAVLRGLGLALMFGLAHVAYLDLVVVLPVVGLALVLSRRASPATRVLGAGLLLLAPLGFYGSFIEPSRVTLERAEVSLPAARAGERAVTIGVLADLQFRRVGAPQREAVRRVMAERPDVIVLPGDIHQGSRASLARALPEIRKLLGRLRAPGGVYFVPGDAERRGEARRVTAGTAVRVLRNDVARTRVGDRTLAIGGIELNYRSAAARRTVRRLERAPGRGDARILLSHRPDPVLDLARRTRIDLVVAGHTHGGQIQLPLIGPPFIASAVPRDVGAGGLHELGSGSRRRIYVSRGIGLERGQAPPVRLLAPPEVSLLRVG
jgi:predicted MPP superfamily phosphohydrolase